MNPAKSSRPGTTRIGEFSIRAHGDHEIVMTRAFSAPQQLVFDAFVEPEIVRQWLLGPDGWSMPVCEIDARPGGRIRYVWKDDGRGREMGMTGEFREVTPPARLVHVERFDDPWFVGDALVTTEFVEARGQTTVTMTMRLDTREARDGVLESGMETGVAASYDRLERILAARR